MRRPGERGSAALEAAALIPLVMGVLVMIAQIFAMAYASHGVSQSARDSARAYSLGASPEAAAAASLPSGVSLVSVSTFGPSHGVTVTALAPSIVFLTDRTGTRSVTMP
jgi:Flp pilus assembly protein TadG